MPDPPPPTWRCASCGCTFPDHPSNAYPPEVREAAMAGVTRCSKCVEVEMLLAENDRLRAALQPFADYAHRVDDSADDLNPIGDACPPAGFPSHWQNATPLPTVGHCRRAAAVLSQHPRSSS